MAYALLLTLDVKAVTGAMTDGILKPLNRLCAGTEKYHKTLPAAWMLLVHDNLVATDAAATYEESITANATLLDVSLLQSYYSPELLATGAAQREFVAADLRPLR